MKNKIDWGYTLQNTGLRLCYYGIGGLVMALDFLGLHSIYLFIGIFGIILNPFSLVYEEK